MKKSNREISEIILDQPQKEWENQDAIICDPIKVNKVKAIK